MISYWSFQWFGNRFPFGTLVVNVLGCLLLGIAYKIAEATETSEHPHHIGLSVGLLGALTTFSTFSLETIRRFEEGQVGIAMLNIVGNLALCLLAVWCGLAVARLLPGT